MSITLEIALVVASIAIVALAGSVVPTALQMGRSLRALASTTERLEANAQLLLKESRQLVQAVSDLSSEIGRSVAEVGEVARSVRSWTGRVHQCVQQVGLMLELPLFSLVRNSDLLRVGAAAFLRTLLHPDRQELQKQNNPEGKEHNHA